MQKERFGDVIKRLRTEKGLSLEDVRKRARGQLATSYISKIENNDAHPATISVGMLERLAAGLGEPVIVLFNFITGFQPELSPDAERLRYFADELPADRLRDLIDIGEMFLTRAETERRSAPVVAHISPADAEAARIRRELQNGGIPLATNSRRKIPAQLKDTTYPEATKIRRVRK